MSTNKSVMGEGRSSRPSPIDPSVLDKLWSRSGLSVKDRIKIASHSSATAEQLDRWSTHSEPTIRVAVAGHKNVSSSSLLKMIRSSRNAQKGSKNLRSSQEVLVRREIASRSEVSPNVFGELALDRDLEVLEKVVMHRQVSNEALRKIIRCNKNKVLRPQGKGYSEKIARKRGHSANGIRLEDIVTMAMGRLRDRGDAPKKAF